MAKIIINIDMEELKSGVNQLVDDDMYEDDMMEEEVSCPLSTQDSSINDENRESAIKDQDYGAAEGDKNVCGTCAYYDIRASVLDCIDNGIGMKEDVPVGYCTELDFTCMADNVCNLWKKGGPITDFDNINTLEPIEGNERDIF